MNKAFIKIMVIPLLTVLLFSGCGQKSNKSNTVYTPKHSAESIFRRASNIQSAENMKTTCSIESFSYYSVHKITDSKNDKPVYGFIMYKESGSLSDGWCTDTLRTYKDFKTLKTGDSLNKVRRIDPYFCLFENINKNIATGYHTLADGTEYVINYRRNNNYDEYHISSMVYKEEKSGLSSILLDIDRHLVEKDE